jgi:hypothetical protein
MADEEPKSRPEAPATEPADPQTGKSIYGSQWGQSGKQNPKDPAQADPASAPEPAPTTPRR